MRTLPDGVVGQLVDEPQHLRQLVGREAASAQEVDDRRRASESRRRSVTTHAHVISPSRSSGTPITAAARTAGDLAQQVLDLARRDVEAAADDDLLRAPDDREVAVVVEHAGVAGVQPPVVGEDRALALGVVEEADAHVRATHHHLAVAATSSSTSGSASPSVCMRLLERRAGAVPAHDERFGEPVDAQHVDARVGARPHDLGRYRRAAAAEAGERRHVATGPLAAAPMRSVRKVVAASVYEHRSRSISSTARSASHAVLQHELHAEVQRQAHAEVETRGVADRARHPHDVVGSRARSPRTPTARCSSSCARCASTPFGVASVPDVKITSDSAAGSTSVWHERRRRAARARRCQKSPSPRTTTWCASVSIDACSSRPSAAWSKPRNSSGREQHFAPRGAAGCGAARGPGSSAAAG